MKKRISDLTDDEANRCMAVQEGWRRAMLRDAEGQFDGWTNGKDFEVECPDFINTPNLWWPIAEKNHFSITYGIGRNAVSQRGIKNDLFLEFEQNPGRAIVLCALMIANPDGMVEVPT